MMTPQLTMTALDTRSLRMWIGTASTRQKPYAVLTMPDFTTDADLMSKPDVAFAAGFGRYAYADLRTDHFSGALVEPARHRRPQARILRRFDPLSRGPLPHSAGSRIPSACM